MKRVLLFVLLCVSMFGVKAQTVERDVNGRVGQAMNANEWFELARIYSTDKENIDPFLRTYAESLLATVFGRPAEGAMAIERLTGTYGEWLGDGAVGMWFYWGVNQARMGEYATAAEGFARELAKLKGRVDDASIAPMLDIVRQWRELSQFERVNSLERSADGDVHIPFRLVSLRPEQGDAQQIRFSAKFNGEEQEVVFDTGASVNVASVEAAERLGLKMLDAESEAQGVGGVQQGRYAVAERIDLGNATLHNVPFYVISIKTGVDSLDARYMSHLNVIMGAEMMRAMGEVHIDFENSELFSPRDEQLTEECGEMNLCATPSLYEVECQINGERQIVSIDTGAGDSNLSSQYFATHREQIEREGRVDTLRSAGAGGVKIERAYELSNVNISIGGASHTWEKIMCSTEEDIIWRAANIGMDCLATFPRVVINTRTMRLRIEPKR